MGQTGAVPADSGAIAEHGPRRRPLDRGQTPAERLPSRCWSGSLLGLLAAIVIRALLLPTEGLRDDSDQFAGWVAHIATNGLPNAYDQNLSFGPVMAYIWALLGVIEPAFRNGN